MYKLIIGAINVCLMDSTSDISYADILNYLILLQTNMMELQNVYDHECFKYGEWITTDIIISCTVLAKLPDPLEQELRKYYPGRINMQLPEIFDHMHKCVQNVESSNVSNSSTSKPSSDKAEFSSSSLSTNSVVMSSSPSPEGKFKPCVFCVSTSHASSNCDNCSSYEAR